MIKQKIVLRIFVIFFLISVQITIVIVGIRGPDGAPSIPPESLRLLTLWCGLDQKPSSDHNDARTGLNSRRKGHAAIHYS